ncbi:uncharacterized protein LOC569174 [Danio rerio]|uniref:Uncharacterized protein LOC569174 n=1 Tax=Danio rerio TaxID=7955 RepID=Q4V8V5_DANRE|nr:uncharacterized protein LOC569174 [Danio rerio]AAH97181.1 Zgc:114123 [Danio rerio]|eukprot:NP_001025403.1 uncharacterized protein LOC569174 [Danio rerio]
MELCLYGQMLSCGQLMSLEELLQVQDQPLSEEQAWALGFQLCSLFSHHTRRTVVSAAADGVLLSADGSVSLRPVSSITGDSLVIETEEQAVEFVGRLVYLSLDWGLETQVERELSETLEILLCQMTRVTCRQPVCSIADVIQVCRKRLRNPAQADQHYKSVCRSLFLHSAELFQYLQIVQQSRKSLQKLLESETQIVAKVSTDWVFVWKDLVEELSRGVVLRPSAKSLTVKKRPVPVEIPPFHQLLRDIQSRRYTLRKVQDVSDGQRKADAHQTLLEFIRSRPTLRPASERKMGLKPKKQSSLHELLMEEIRSADHSKRLNRSPRHHNNGLTVPEDSTGLKAPALRIPAHDDSESPVPDSNFTDFRGGAGKRRTRSFACNRDLLKAVKSRNQGSVLKSIVDVLKMQSPEKRGDVSNMTCERYQDWRVCSCCAMRSLYFTWHNVCSVCRRVVCPGCCVEMRLPSQHCVNLPLSFFKQIVMKDCEQSQRNFWSERWSWNSAWIPLVLVSGSSSSSSLHTLAMRDWYSQDICVSCQTDLLEACGSVLSRCPIRDSQEI